MSQIADLLERLRGLDVRLTLDGDRLGVSAPKGALSVELRGELANRKDEIKAHLAAHPQAATGLPVSHDPGVVRVLRRPHMPVSHNQQRLWFLQRMNPSSIAYNVSSVVRISGELNAQALGTALEELVARHEALRTCFVEIDGAPRSVIDATASTTLQFVDVRHLEAGVREDEAIRRIMVLTEQPFDIGRAPLVRAMLVHTAPLVHLFCLIVHHLVADGLSLALLYLELQTLYAARLEGRSADLPALEVQAIDQVEWQSRWLASGAMDKLAAYWKEQLRGLPPVLPLPLDRPRPRLLTSNGAREVTHFELPLADAIRAFARREGVTLYMVLMAAFQVLLHRHTGEEDIAIGSVIGGRHRPELERVIGFLANSVVHRGRLAGQPTFRELLVRVRETAMKSYAHQDMPFDLLVELLAPRRDLDHSPLFQVLFVVHNEHASRIVLGNLECDPVDLPIRTARFDLAVDIFDRRDSQRVWFEYNTDLFDASTIKRMLGHYRVLIESVLAAPDTRIGDLPMLSQAEYRQVVCDWNQTAIDLPGPGLVHGMFEAQCARDPSAMAVHFEGQSLSYGELNDRSNRLARYLQGLGVTCESLVGVWMDRSAEMVVALMGILKAGGAYVPLDPAFPRERIEFMVDDAQLKVVVTQARLAGSLPGTGLHSVSIDADWPQIALQAGTNLPAMSTPGNLAYVIYTSGSTGRPKGVEVEHRAVANFLGSMHREPGISATDRWVSVTTLSFDIAGLEIHGPLTAGGAVILASRSTALDAQRLAALLSDSRATILQATPATWRLLLDSGWRGQPQLKMLCGGEALPRELAERLLTCGGELWNMYGPTETTIWSTLNRVTELSSASVPIGVPIANTSVYVLEPSGLPAPVGVAGELCIGGAGLARGYRKRAELSAEKFVVIDLPDGAGGHRSERVYRSGDMARFLGDGRLEFLGRRDQQVKLRGFRIELGEIETVLTGQAGVTQAVVSVREDTVGDPRLVAYVVVGADESFDADAARSLLRAQLPEYMVPQLFVTLPSLPLTPNGKVDRKALPAPQVRAAAAGEVAEPLMTPLQRRVASAWREVLGLDRVGLHANFFDLGGHSLRLVKLQAVLQREFGRDLPLVELFERTTVAAQAERLDAPSIADAALQRAQARARKQVHG